MGIARLVNLLKRDRKRQSIDEVIEITRRLEQHFARHANPGTPGSADSVARSAAWIRNRVTGAETGEQLRNGARDGLHAMRGGMASLTDTYVGEDPADYAMIERSWKQLRTALELLL
ncbi:hypothetical protein [Paeniglutamicibacter psychrophenolicus]|uniref:hypothetical protein n=1 Tax=Paeniglutamicibacter psychrophenolicus TaxID=257454 RepID=UPI00277D24C2|nr:hypothetical protein [Paeniglutamicibacter psychrophenolicus]MDQ0094457.1 hypothetical protein [Paeniglutamicibacter psychrophenolicus]